MGIIAREIEVRAENTRRSFEQSEIKDALALFVEEKKCRRQSVGMANGELAEYSFSMRQKRGSLIVHAREIVAGFRLDH